MIYAAIATASAVVVILLPFLRWSVGRNVAKEDAERAALRSDFMAFKDATDEMEQEILHKITDLQRQIGLNERDAIERFVLRKEWDAQNARFDRMEAKIDRLLENKRLDR